MDEIPDVSEQTELEHGPIKIRWESEDRARVRRGLRAALADGYMEKGIAFPCMMRQKTQVVIKTEEELEAFRDELQYKAKRRVRDRIEDEIRKQRNPDEHNDAEESQHSEAYQRRKADTDLDTLMEEVVIPHARQKVNEVWPGGTVDVDDITWFWNNRLSTHAGMAYRGRAVPNSVDGQLAIGLAPAYYYKHGTDDLLELVRHELIHIWCYEHPDCDSGEGHGPKFKQWLDDMDTSMHGKWW